MRTRRSADDASVVDGHDERLTRDGRLGHDQRGLGHRHAGDVGHRRERYAHDRVERDGLGQRRLRLDWGDGRRVERKWLDGRRIEREWFQREWR